MSRKLKENKNEMITMRKKISELELHNENLEDGIRTRDLKIDELSCSVVNREASEIAEATQLKHDLDALKGVLQACR